MLWFWILIDEPLSQKATPTLRVLSVGVAFCRMSHFIKIRLEFAGFILMKNENWRVMH
jgi:hypothetical protein